MPDQWDAYIDVIGEGKYVEEVEAYVADVILNVRAASDEASVREVAELRDRCVKTLVASGLGYDEITDGGARSASRGTAASGRPGSRCTS